LVVAQQKERDMKKMKVHVNLAKLNREEQLINAEIAELREEIAALETEREYVRVAMASVYVLRAKTEAST
jgi:prefoldin subunit 5